MVSGFDPLTLSSLLIMAAAPVQCNVPKAPSISVNPTSKAIQYDYSRSALEIGAIGRHGGTVSPYGAKAKTVTMGLRKDEPKFSYQISLGYQYYPDQDALCAYYDSVTVKIELAPYIYIADEIRPGKCRNEVKKHEERHVSIDRQVINKYARQIGAAIQKAVNEAGAMGPVRMEKRPEIEQLMMSHVDAAIQTQNLAMHAEMQSLQSKVDSYEEYERVSKLCEGQPIDESSYR